MALPPTLHQKKNNPFPIDAARCEDYPQDPTSPHDNISTAAAVVTTIPLMVTIEFYVEKRSQTYFHATV